MVKKKRVTIRDVAARAGVSATAVSFAFNAPEQLNHDTCARIQEIAAEMNYQPHPVARTLATGRTNTIGLVLPVNLHFALQDAFFRIFISEFGRLCDKHRLHLLLLPIWKDSTLSSLDAIAADGFLVIGINQSHPISKAVAQSSRPVILLDSEEDIPAPSFVLDDFKGAYLAMTHLLDKGHTHIAVSATRYTTSMLKAMPFDTRLRGYKKAIQDRGLGSDALQIVFTEEDDQLLNDRQPFNDIWALPRRPTAVACVSDTRAVKILRAAKEDGLHVPDDLAIVGFDNIPEASHTLPGITTVDQDILGRSQRTFELLHTLIAETGKDKEKVQVDNSVYMDPVRLVVRGSS